MWGEVEYAPFISRCFDPVLITVEGQATCTSPPAHSPPNLHEQHISLSEGVVPIPQDWPAEIVDSMAWSAQFSGAVQSGWQL